jgi:hypothetical protein
MWNPEHRKAAVRDGRNIPPDIAAALARLRITTLHFTLDRKGATTTD